MGYYKNLFTKSGNKGFKAFLFQVNDLGESVVYPLDEDGNPTDFTVSHSLINTVRNSVREVDHNIVVLRIGPEPGENGSHPFRYGFGRSNRWSEVVKALNGKGMLAGEYRAQWRLFRTYGVPLPFICMDEKGNKLILTKEGEDADAAMEQEES